MLAYWATKASTFPLQKIIQGINESAAKTFIDIESSQLEET